MDDALQSRVEVLAREIAGQTRTIEDVNGLMRLMMKSALERMLDTEMDVHLGRRPLSDRAEESAATATACSASLEMHASTEPMPTMAPCAASRSSRACHFSCSGDSMLREGRVWIIAVPVKIKGRDRLKTPWRVGLSFA